MKTLRGYEEAIGRIGAFELDEFRLIEKMTLRVTGGTTSPIQVLELDMRTDQRSPGAEIRLRFIGVQNFKVDSWPPGQVRLPGFKVLDISERQLEGLVWQIRDYEEDSIGFLCKDVKIVSASFVHQLSQ